MPNTTNPPKSAEECLNMAIDIRAYINERWNQNDSTIDAWYHADELTDCLTSMMKAEEESLRDAFRPGRECI